VRFSVLGQLEIRRGATVQHLHRVKPKVVLALLLANANQLVSRSMLVDELWGRQPPASAAANLYTYVWAIRNTLAVDGSSHRLSCTTTGYRLAIGAGELDALAHQQLTNQGRDQLRRGDVAEGAESIRRAVTLWRGQPLAELPTTPAIDRWIDSLQEQHRSAVRDWTDARLRLGLDDELVGGLRASVDADPLCERVRAQLVIALYRAGRVGEALNAFADARHTLAEELGLEPGPLLAGIQRAILDRDPALSNGDPSPWLSPAFGR